MKRTADDAFEARVKTKVGPLAAIFTVDVEIIDADPPNGYTLKASARGGPAGFGKGEARVTLSADAGDTLLRYDISGSVGGKLAQVGQRLIDGVGRKMADDFFAAFGEAVAPGEPRAIDRQGAARRPARASWLIAIVAAAAAVAAALLFLR